MVLDILPSDALTEVPELQHYTKLTWTILFLQSVITIIYHLGRHFLAGIEYGSWPKDYVCNYLHKYNMSEYNKDTMEDWEMYNCANYDYKMSNMDIDELPFCAGLSYPWVGGIWFVLTVWTSTLPQEPWICNRFTALSIILNLIADIVNFWNFRMISFFTLIGFSIVIFFCLKFMRTALEKLSTDIEHDDFIDIPSIDLKKTAFGKIRIIFLLGLAQVYISLPSYRYGLEKSLLDDIEKKMFDYDKQEQMFELLRHLIPIAAGGIINVTFVSSVLFSDIIKIHFVDVFKGNVTILETLIGFFQSISFFLALALTKVKLPQKNKVVLEQDDKTLEVSISEGWPKNFDGKAQFFEGNLYLTLICGVIIWILVLSVAYNVTKNGKKIPYFNQRWIMRNTSIARDITKETWKNHIIRKDKLMVLRESVQDELDILSNTINNKFISQTQTVLFETIEDEIQTEIMETKIKKILPKQVIDDVGDLTSSKNLYTQLDDLYNISIKEPLETMNMNIKQYIKEYNLNNEEIFIEIKNLVNDKIISIEKDTKTKLDHIKKNIKNSLKSLRTSSMLQLQNIIQNRKRLTLHTLEEKEEQQQQQNDLENQQSKEISIITHQNDNNFDLQKLDDIMQTFNKSEEQIHDLENQQFQEQIKTLQKHNSDLEQKFDDVMHKLIELTNDMNEVTKDKNM